MLSRFRAFHRYALLLVSFMLTPCLHSSPTASWNGVLRDAAGSPVGAASIKVVDAISKQEYSVTASVTGLYTFASIPAGSYTLMVASSDGKIWTATDPVVFK